MSERVLPEQFADLEPFVNAWALATEAERQRKRLASTMEEMRAFYNALLPRMEAILSYLNQFAPDQLPEDAKRLFYLSLSLSKIAPAVELYQQPSVPDGFDPDRLVPLHTIS